MSDFNYSQLFQSGADKTNYKFLGNEGVSVEKIGDREFLKVAPEALSKLSNQAFFDISQII